IVHEIADLAHGRSARGFSRRKLTDNPAWPPELASATGAAAHERFVTILPLALSRTQDDKGRVRWTVFGGSEQGPGRAFWRSFWLTPRRQTPASAGEGFVRRLLNATFGVRDGGGSDAGWPGFAVARPLGGSRTSW